MSLKHGILESKVRLIVVGNTINITNNSAVFTAAGTILSGSNSTTVTSSAAWTSSITYNQDSGWITVTPASGSSGQGVTISVDGNDFGSVRTGDVSFICGNASTNFDITQNAP
jgi:hypothetical protein